MKNFALKTVLFVCLFAGMTATAQTQAKLSHGEILEVRIIDGFDGKNVPQAINAVTDTDIKDPVTRQTVIRRGTPVRIEAKVEKPKGLGREGKIRLHLLTSYFYHVGKAVLASRFEAIDFRTYDSNLVILDLVHFLSLHKLYAVHTGTVKFHTHILTTDDLDRKSVV